MTITNALRTFQAHGVAAWPSRRGFVAVVQRYVDTATGRPDHSIVELPLSRRAVTAWLGY